MISKVLHSDIVAWDVKYPKKAATFILIIFSTFMFKCQNKEEIGLQVRIMLLFPCYSLSQA